MKPETKIIIAMIVIALIGAWAVPNIYLDERDSRAKAAETAKVKTETERLQRETEAIKSLSAAFGPSDWGKYEPDTSMKPGPRPTPTAEDKARQEAHDRIWADIRRQERGTGK